MRPGVPRETGIAGCLFDRLEKRIATGGPIAVADYMAECLGHPRFGYYATRDPFGQAGDFTTAPEISQMFGEMLGVWCLDYWERMGRPNPVDLIELGPGRGTLMADLLRAARAQPAFSDAARIALVETSPALRARQAESLESVGAGARWLDAFPAELDGPPVLVIANEFLDALPILQFQARQGAWVERRIGLSESERGLAFVAGAGIGAVHPLIPRDIQPGAQSDGAVFEIRPAGLALMTAVAERLHRTGGAALFIDYGHARSEVGDTFQAVRGHAFADPLRDPGDCDLTAHVDFAMLADAGRQAGAHAFGPKPQGAFLRALGVEARAERLKATATPAQSRDIDTALRRLISEREMGALFKAMAATGPNGPAPAGFESPV